MAGDPLHVAFFAHLTTELVDECSLVTPWTVKDTRNTGLNPDASAPYVDFEITPQSIDQYTTGAPGSNFHQEQGQIIISFKVPFGDAANQVIAGTYAAALLARFLYSGTRFSVGDRTCRLFSPMRLSYGEDDGGMWIETMAVSYEIFHVG